MDLALAADFVEAGFVVAAEVALAAGFALVAIAVFVTGAAIVVRFALAADFAFEVLLALFAGFTLEAGFALFATLALETAFGVARGASFGRALARGFAAVLRGALRPFGRPERTRRARPARGDFFGPRAAARRLRAPLRFAPPPSGLPGPPEPPPVAKYVIPRRCPSVRTRRSAISLCIAGRIVVVSVRSAAAICSPR